MLRYLSFSLFILSFLFISCQEKERGSQGENFESQVDRTNEDLEEDVDLSFFDNPHQPLESSFQFFPNSSIYPKGWILNIMKQDLEEGMVGALEDLYPGIKSDDLYNTARRGSLADVPEMGDLVLTGAAWEQSIMWWNAETIGNWWDGFIRHAFLTQDENAIQKANDIVQGLMDSQDEDGYLGIYKPELRYQHEGSNGELWAQTTALRAMIAHYEFTANPEALASIEAAVQLTMKEYGEQGRNPFDLKNAFGGVTHGLMFTDVCEELYRITGKEEYLDYGIYLYKTFSEKSINRSFNDLRYPFLMQREAHFEGHGVHTYEHIRTLMMAYYHSGYPELKEAYQNMLYKLEPCILPSGAGYGNEWISELKADPDHTGTEFCTMLELRNSYSSLFQKTADISFADAAEKLTYNGIMGARARDGKAIAYGKRDNSYIVNETVEENGELKKEPRYKYSPTHSEPAVCCVPNYARNFPYFIQSMYMMSDNGIAVTLYGPSVLKTEIDGVKVEIEQETNYPFSDSIRLIIRSEEAVEFALYLRKPKWTESITFSEEMTEEGDFYVIEKSWKDDELILLMNNPIRENEAFNGEKFIQKGAIVFAYEIPYEKPITKEYAREGFTDYHCLPKSESYKNVTLPQEFELTNKTAKSFDFYSGAYQLTGTNEKGENIALVPMGRTVLRKVTF